MNEDVFVDIVNRRRECREIVRRIERDLDVDFLAKRLKAISARRYRRAEKR